VTKETPDHLYFAFVPRSNTDSASYWWAAMRYMQAHRTLREIEPLVQRIYKRINDQQWPWVRGVPDEPHAGALTWEVPYAREIITANDKREASFIASQTLHYLRSALDHLIYHAAWFDAGTPQKQTQFPIFDDAAKWATKNGAAKHLRGVSQAHINVVEAAQPFNGGTWAADLQELSNADKHRFGVEVSPTLQIGIDFGSAVDDQARAGGKLARVDTVSLRLLLPPLENREFTDVFDAMFVGAADVINPFLQEQGISPLRLGPPHVISAESVSVADGGPGVS